ncbi:MAG: SMEK domain-containing protein [Clostridiales bacterium]|nr:SMEK domain-containing protein [Clostridiales bacterium]
MTRTHTDKQQLISMFAYIQLYLEYNGKQGLLDENKILEDIMCEVLNRVYGWHLKNLNYEEKNYPGIDLGDPELGLGIQVTVDKTSTKINHSISQIIKHEVYKKYPNLKILILGKKQASYSIQNPDQDNETVLFDAKKDIIDFSDVLNATGAMKASERHELAEYLRAELGWNCERTQSRVMTYEKVQKYLAEQHKENSYITVLGLQKKLPIENAWMRLNIMTEEEIQKKQAETQWEFLRQYDEYSSRSSNHTYDVETLLVEPGNKVVLAGPGMGKSTLCKKLFCQAEFMHISAIKVRLWDVSGYMREGVSFEEALRKAMTQSLAFQFDKEDLSSFFSLLILDGLDECGDYRRMVAKAIAAWGFGHPDQRIVVTSRPIGYDAAELADFRHYQILPIDEYQMESFSRQLMEMVQPDCEENYQWFAGKLKNRELHKLARRSPLVLGFMVQLSLKRKEFGTSKVSLYQAIIEEWLQGSSRENEKPLSEAELHYGIEAIAYYMMNNVSDVTGDAYTKHKIVTHVGNSFAKEMEYSSLKAKQAAEQCLDFWLERGILDKGIHKEQECFLFLHLNVGEYLAACYLAKLPQEEKKEWVAKHYRDNIWQETLRMAIACETDDCFVQELLAIEAQNQLPAGAVFLAAQGIGENGKKHVPQALYDKLLDYAFGDNTYLCQKSAQVIDCLQGGEIDWHVDQLEEYAKSEDIWKQLVAYHVLFIALFGEREKLQLWARSYVIHYPELMKKTGHRTRFHDLAKAIQILVPDSKDKKLTESLKKISFEHTTVSEMEAIGKYLEAVGERKWFDARYESLMGGLRDFPYEQANNQIRQGEKKLIEILSSLFGTTPSEKIHICHEYSKISAVMRIMESYIPDIRWLGIDLEREHSKELIQAITTAVDLDQEQLKKELYSLSHFADENRTFISSDHIVYLHIKGNWSRCMGTVRMEVIKEGLYSHSDILGYCAMNMAYYNLDTPAVLDLFVKMFRTSPAKRVVSRAGTVLSARGYEDLAMYAEERLNDDSVPSFPCLYHFLPETPDYQGEPVTMWLSCIRQGLSGDRYLVTAALKYILNVKLDGMPENVKLSLTDMIKASYDVWNTKKVKCLHCKDTAIIEPTGFCPKCNVGADMPTKYFVEVLARFHFFSMEEYIVLCQHPMSDVVKIAERELKKIWMSDQKKLESVIYKFENDCYDAHIYELILQLPSQITASFQEELQRLGMKTNERMLVIWIQMLRSLEWIPADCMKGILCECLSHESDEVRNKAMACWLDD